MTSEQTAVATRGGQAGPMQNLLREFVFIIYDRIWLVRITFALVLLASLGLAFLLPSVYRATARFSISIPQSIDPLQQENTYDYRNRATRVLRDQKELIFSNRVLERVARQFYGDASAKTIDRMRRELLVAPPKGETYEGSNIFFVSYDDHDAARSAEIAGAIANSYIATYGEVGKERSAYSHDFFTTQTEQLRQEMAEKEKALRDFETQQAAALLEILNLVSTSNSNEVGPTAILTQATQKYHALQEELVGLRATAAAIEGELSQNKIPVVLPELEVQGRSLSVLKNKVAQLQIELNDMKPRFTPDFELYQQVEKSLEFNIVSLREELQRVARAKEMSAQAIEARMAELEGIIGQLKDHTEATATEKSNYEHLKQEYLIAKDAYVNSRNQLEQARLSQALNQEKQSIVLLDKPIPPAKPHRPNRVLIALLGVVAGLLLSVAFALTADYFDHTIKSPQDIEFYLEAPFLGSLPRAAQDTTRR